MAHPCHPKYCDNCDRFGGWYRITGTEDEALAKARDLCLEQTVEYPADMVPEGFIQDQVVGQVAEFETIPGEKGAYRALITFLHDDAGMELTQLLNVLYGNISLKKGFRLESLRDCRMLWNLFKGPRFGREGLREILGIPRRPLLCVPLKPLGLSSTHLALTAGRLAEGGIDIIKDDHGLANQPFAPFKERVERCADAVRKGAEKASRKILYAPNVTAQAGEMAERAAFAKKAGAGALLVCPGLTGLDSMRQLADDNSLALPILAHPAFLGSFVTSPDNGISPYALFGQIMRLAGADASIYPHSGGRFGFSLEECRDIARGTGAPMGDLKPIFPMPGGGMSLDRIPELMDFYGNNVLFLMGGDLMKQGSDIETNCKLFVETVEKGLRYPRTRKVFNPLKIGGNKPKHVCPWWLGYLLASPLRRLWFDPGNVLAPFVTPGMTVLEPGPGMGFLTLELAKRVGPEGKVVAVDIQPQMINRLKKRADKAGLRGRIDARLADPGSLGIGDLEGKVDFVLAFAMVHEVEDPSAFFGEIARALKVGGKVLLAEPKGHVNEKDFAATLDWANQYGLKASAGPQIKSNHTGILEKI